MSSMPVKNYVDILQSLKEKIRQARLRASLAVNAELLSMYWEIGDTINKQEQAEGWGTKTVEKLAIDLRIEFPDMKGLSPRNLRYMREFALAYPQFSILQQHAAKLEDTQNQMFTILQQLVAKLPWGHNCVLLDRIKQLEEKLFYAQKAVQNGWSRAILINQVESGLYKRQGVLSNNFINTLPAYQSELAAQLFKDPYHLDFVMLGEEAKERDLENALMEHITKLLLELGEGFAFMGRQKKFEAGGKEFFIDLLFYNTKLRRHIIIELKIGGFEAEFISKMNLYLGLADDTLKGQYDEPSIGLILCKTNNKIVAEYALRDTTKPIGIAEYKIAQILPDNIKGELPSIEEIEQRMDQELKGKPSPVDARLKMVKEKLKTVVTDELQTPATYQILQDLFANGLKPLYQQIIQKLFTEFNELFLNQTLSWGCNGQVVYGIEEVQVFWGKEENLRLTRKLEFSYHLNGFRKAGTENYDEYLQLIFVMDTYWYGFYLNSYNNNQPIFKNMFHQPLSKENIQFVEDAMVSKVLDKIDWIINNIATQ